MAHPKPAQRKHEPVPMTMRTACQIMDEVSSAFGVSKADMIGASRLRTIAYARFEAWHRMRSQIRVAGYEVSLPRIASWFGRHHTTVLAGLQAYNTDEVQRRIEAIKRSVATHKINAEQPVNKHDALWPNRSYYGRIKHEAAALPTPAAPLLANT